MQTRKPLFSDGPATDQANCNLRDPRSSNLARIGKAQTERLWQQYQEFADHNFLDEIRKNFHARFWEMYLTCVMLDTKEKHGHSISCPKPGPDVLLSKGCRRLWIEAVIATDGDPSKPDSLIKPALRQAYRVPDEHIIMRYSTALDSKFRKLESYKKSGLVRNIDSCIIALNGGSLSYRWADAEMPRILKALFPLGHLQVAINTSNSKIDKTFHQFRPAIYKSNGSPIATDCFSTKENNHISAILYSNANAISSQLGGDFIIIHNFYATNPVEKGLFPVFREYWAEQDGDHMRLCCEERA